MKPTLAEWSAPVFVVAATTGFLLLVALQALMIVWLTYGVNSPLQWNWFAGWLWALLTTLALLWGVVNVRWGLRELRNLKAMAGYGHWGIALCCGLIALGLQALMAARSMSDQPIILDYSHLGAAAPRPAPAEPAAVIGDPVEGKKLFAMSCVTCHGPTGDGLNNLAPSLRESEFIQAADMSAILRVIRLGRAIQDPANKSGKVMPARGGNPFLTDEQAAHLAAFVKSLPEQQAATPADEAGPPQAQLARWVVPPATVPPTGLIKLNPDRDLIGTEAYHKQHADRRKVLTAHLGLAAVAVHGLSLFGLFLMTSHLVFGLLLEISSPGVAARFHLTAWGWCIATGAWIVIVVLFGLS